MKSATPLNIINLIEEKMLDLSSLMEELQSSENQSLFFKHSNEAKQKINQIKLDFYSLRKEIDYTKNEKETAKENSSEQELLNKALSLAKTGLWQIDFKKNTLKLSSQLLELLERSAMDEETDLRSWLELLHIDDRERVRAEFNNFIRRRKKVFDSTFRLKKKSNDWVWIKCIGQSYYAKKSDNLPSLIFGIAYSVHSEKTIDLEKDRLISELKKSNFATEETALEIIEMYQELAESRKHYIEMNQKKDELISILSVELQSSILGFLSLSNLIYQEYHNFSKDEIKDAFKEINISSKNLFDFLENVLLWTQIQNKKIDYKPNFFYLKDIINESLILFSNVIQNKELSIENKVDEKIVVFVDYDMINSLFRNLISNAIKFSKKHAKIILNNKAIEAKSSFVELSIKDQGIGIDGKAKKYIFSFNKKVIRRGCDNEVGSGLGLVLCKEFIKYHKGKIRFKSKKNEGTIFYFTLPLVRI